MVHTPLKSRVRLHLAAGELEEVVELAAERRRVLGALVALTFDPDLQVVWRAIEAMGMAVERVAGRHKAHAKEHMRRLYWLITEESGGVFWRAPECMAECCARLPVFFKDHLPIAFHLLETLAEEDLEHFRPGALWAIGRLAKPARDHIPAILPLVVDALDRPEPQARGMAVWCLGEVGETSTLAQRPSLLEDEGAVFLYRDRTVIETTVDRLTREILEQAAH
jgi:methylated-DNA-[protein]-cysteine S-methyltransferase